jgi:hypothetical protein
MKISKIILYNEPSIPEIQIERLQKFLEKQFPVNVEIRENILKYSFKETARKIAECKIFYLKKDFEKHSPTEEEIQFEEFNIQDTSITQNIIMYDGFQLQKIFNDLIPKQEKLDCFFHICFTNKLTCTFDYNDYRYHGRALIGANPSIISTTGIIEAPAKPREYYIDLMTSYPKGVNVESIKQKYKGTYLEKNDQRLSNVIEGYILQAIFYYETGEPFCQNINCRLFNAHWQKDLLHSQLEIGTLCQEHQTMMKKIIQE